MARRMIRDRRTTAPPPPPGPGTCDARPPPVRRQRLEDRPGRRPGRVRPPDGHLRACGSIADLERQGLVRRTRRPRRGNLTATVPYRAASFERLRDCGLNLAWGHDPLMSSNNRGLRVQRARRLKAERRQVLAEVRAEERQVAMLMAEDRFALTLTGLFALQNADRGRA